MSSITTRISTFIASLESHPNATDLIPLVEQLLNVDDVSTETQLAALLMDLCSDNPDLIIDFWLLRGNILLEEGYSTRAVSVFWKAVQIQPLELSTWDQVINAFLSQEDFIYATYFLTKAQEVIPDNSNFSSMFQQSSRRVLANLQIPPGIKEVHADIQDSNTLLEPQSPEKILPPSFHNPWKMMLECFEGNKVSSNQKDKQSFVTYAHSAMRELLGLDGNFRDGLDQVLIQLRLTDYKQPLMRLNHIRNRIAHANYIPSKKELQNFYTLVHEIVIQYKKHSVP